MHLTRNMDKLRRAWQVVDAADSIWSKVGYLLLPIGGVGGVYGMLMNVSLPEWGVATVLMATVAVLGPIPVLMIDRATKRRTERMLRKVAWVLWQRDQQLADKDAQMGNTLGGMLDLLDNMSKTNLERHAKTLQHIADLEKGKVDKPEAWERLLGTLDAEPDFRDWLRL